MCSLNKLLTPSKKIIRLIRGNGDFYIKTHSLKINYYLAQNSKNPSKQLRGIYDYFRFQNIAMMENAFKYIKLLNAKNIFPLMTKGAALRIINPNNTRYMFDVDLTVREFDAAVNIARDMGYKINTVASHSIDLTLDNRFNLDLHARPAKFISNEISEKIWSRAKKMTLNGATFYIPTNADLIFINITALYAEITQSRDFWADPDSDLLSFYSDLKLEYDDYILWENLKDVGLMEFGILMIDLFNKIAKMNLMIPNLKIGKFKNEINVIKILKLNNKKTMPIKPINLKYMENANLHGYFAGVKGLMADKPHLSKTLNFGDKSLTINCYLNDIKWRFDRTFDISGEKTPNNFEINLKNADPNPLLPNITSDEVMMYSGARENNLPEIEYYKKYHKLVARDKNSLTYVEKDMNKTALMTDFTEHLFAPLIAYALSEMDIAMIHSAAIDGVLIAGNAGRGKSTLALAGLNKGIEFVGDDYIAIDKNHNAYPIYSFATATMETVDLLGEINGEFLGDNWNGAKHLFGVKSMAKSFKIKAVVLPNLTDNESPEMTEIPPMRVMAEIISGTIKQLNPNNTKEYIKRIVNHLGGLKFYRFDTTRDPQKNIKFLGDFINEIK